MRTLFTFRRPVTVEPLLPGDFDDEFTRHVNARRRRADLLAAARLLRPVLAALTVLLLAVAGLAAWLAR